MKLATGSCSVQGKVRFARNGSKGRHWLELRLLTKSMDAVLREQREQLAKAPE